MDGRLDILDMICANLKVVSRDTWYNITIFNIGRYQFFLFFFWPVFCHKTMGPGIHEDVTLTRTRNLKIDDDHVYTPWQWSLMVHLSWIPDGSVVCGLCLLTTVTFVRDLQSNNASSVTPQHFPQPTPICALLICSPYFPRTYTDQWNGKSTLKNKAD